MPPALSHVDAGKDGALTVDISMHLEDFSRPEAGQPEIPNPGVMRGHIRMLGLRTADRNACGKPLQPSTRGHAKAIAAIAGLTAQ